MRIFLLMFILFSGVCFADQTKKFGDITVTQQGQVFTITAADKNINIDDYAILSNIDITKDNNYKNLFQKYPNISLWPGNHQFPQSEVLPGGIQRLSFTYQLLNGCETCELAGIARIGFNFDANNNFLGVELLDIEPPPVSS